MEVLTLTQTNIIINEVNQINNNNLENNILKFAKRLSDDVTDTRYEDFNFSFTNDFKNLIEKINTDYKKAFKRQLNLVNFWSQIHEYNESTNLHNHCDVSNLYNSPDLSGVYYVKVPEKSGKIVFEYPINQYQVKRYFINPIVGRYILFPSTLNHFVTKNKSKEKRISISFNFKIENIS